MKEPGHIFLGDEFVPTVQIDISREQTHVRLSEDCYEWWIKDRARWALGYGKSFREDRGVNLEMYRIERVQRKIGATPEDDYYSAYLVQVRKDDILHVLFGLWPGEELSLDVLKENLLTKISKNKD